MPKRRLMTPGCVAVVLLMGSALANASDVWKGSYAADGQCFCSGSMGQEIDSRIVPTPVGGQSVAQVCQRIGAGPELRKVNGKYNFTVYPDAQCGHGPFVSQTQNQQCVGHLGVAGEDCQAKGPQWDFSVYNATQTTELGIAPAANGTSRYIKPPTQKNEPQAAAQTPVAEIAAIRKSSTQIRKPKLRVAIKRTPETPEQIRARQIAQLEAARERLRERQLATAKPVIVEQAKVESTTKPRILPEPIVAAASEISAIPEADTSNNNAVVKESIESVAQASSSNSKAEQNTAPSLLSALQLPLSLERGSREFDYFESAPIRYDFGGTGLKITASKSSHKRLQYLMSVAAARTYQELSVGMGLFTSPQSMPRLTFMLTSGVQTARFKFRDDDVEAQLSDTGAFVNVASRFALSEKVKAQAGMRYSSFFEGDIVGFGEALIQLTSDLDFTSRVEAGDNDMIGFGIRYHY